MTIRVTITNADQGKTRIISAQTFPTSGEPSGDELKELKGGQSADLYVHSTQQIVVKEVRNG